MSHDVMSPFARDTLEGRYAWGTPKGPNPAHPVRESWRDVAERVGMTVMGAVPAPRDLRRQAVQYIAERKFIPGGRYLAATGAPFHQVQNCLLLRAEDTREGWADLGHKVFMASMTGAGIGVVYSDLRPHGARLRRTGGYSSGPIALMNAVNEIGRAARSGGSRRGAIWAGLHWSHPDVMDFIRLKDWSPEVRALKAADFSFPAPMDHTNISIILDDAFFAAYAAGGTHAQEVYRYAVRHACETGEPGFSVDVGKNAGENLRNACTEVTSRDDSDICNLGSINLARITSLSEMRAVVEVATAFLLAGTVYSDVPYAKVAAVREKNRRLGLGLMGVAEYVALCGQQYGSHNASAVLGPYLDKYADSDDYAAAWAYEWGLSRPVKTRAIAPTGTIGIVGETTTGIEPIFCAAYKRRYFDHGTWRAQYVVDPTARKLVQDGMRPEDIEDAYTITPERRIAFQAWAQGYVDHGISSTMNLPPWGSPTNDENTVQAFGDMLMNYLPRVRGVTMYPDGARGGQPLNRVAYLEAVGREGEVITEAGDVCDLRGGGSCGA